MSFPESVRYNRVAVALHWLIAALMICMLLFGEDLMNRRATDASGATWHASIGIAVLVLSVLRLFWRMANPPPPYPATMKDWEKSASSALHYLFYALMLVIPITGVIGYGMFAGRFPALADATIFGLFKVPMITSTWNWGGFHSLLTKLLYPTIALHVVAALKHQFVDKDGILKRMT